MYHTKSIFISTFISLCTLVIVSNCMSVGVTTSKKNLTKRDSDFFPDWVPFKNKHGEELGEFVDVVKKGKVKKRLALPANYQLRPAEEENNEDYFDKGGNEGEDYFEKRDWSDLHRTPAEGTQKPVLNHTDLEDIDGVLFKGPHPTASIHRESNKDANNQEPTSVRSELPTAYTTVQTTTTKVKPTLRRNNHQKRESGEISDKHNQKYEDDAEYEDGFSVTVKKKMPEIVDDDQKEHARRMTVLDMVDDLRTQHIGETGIISDRAKEEEMSREENDRMYGTNPHDKYSTPHILQRKLPLSYDEYDELGSEDDKYKIPREVIKQTLTPTMSPDAPTTTPVYITITTTPKPVKKTIMETGKLSLFRNPNLFMVYEDSEGDEVVNRDTRNYTTTEVPKPESTTESSTSVIDTTMNPPTTTQPTPTTTPTRVYTAPWTPSAYNYYTSLNTHKSTESPERKTERISLVPISPNLDENGPALFFPKPRKLKSKKSKNKGGKIASVIVTSPDITSISSEYKDTLNHSPGSHKYEVAGLSTGLGSTGIDASVSETSPVKKNLTVSESKSMASNINSVPLTKGKAIHRGSSVKHVYPLSVIGPSGADSIPSAADTSPSAVGASAAGALSTSGNALRPTGSAELSVSTPRVSEEVPTGSASASDAISAPSEAQAESHKPENEEHESGGAHQHESEYEDVHGESGKKAYEGFHKDSKSGKGHHDREDHLGKYSDHGGMKKEHHDESGHHGEHHHEEQGKKHAQYEESGKHSKGHSTKGTHNIDKKEEYEKKVEFFEEDGDSGEEEKHGGWHSENEHKKGGRYSNGNHRSDRLHSKKGETGRYEKLLNNHKNMGYRGAGGADRFSKRGRANANAEAGANGKHWIYEFNH